MTFKLSSRSIARLAQCHEDLRRVVEHAITITPIDFAVTETLRTKERQAELVAIGASQTMNSRHLPHPSDGLSRAVDLVALDKGMPSWAWPLYYQIAGAMKEAAATLNIPIEWGGDWKSFQDGPHWQLPWKEYP